jgi:ferritin-like metal-binding protein YciE
METGHELFVHGLNDMLDAEQQLVSALGELARDSSRQYLKKAFGRHQEETKEQVIRLQRCFQLLDEAPEKTECHGIRGLVAEKKAFAEEDPSKDLVDVFNVGAAIKAETYEICEYESLIEMATEMKHREIAGLLRDNLGEEKATLKKMEAFSTKVKPALMMSESQQQKSDLKRKSNRKRPA